MGSSSSNQFDDLHKCNVAHWIRVPLESGATYLFWKAQMENLFKIHDISDIVDPRTTPPAKLEADGTENPLYRVWRKKNFIVLGWIQAAVGPSMFSLVINHDCARACWENLDLHLSPRKICHSQSLRDELRVLKKSDSESMTDFVIKVRALIDSLAAAGDNLADRDKIDFVCDGLGSEYRPFMSSVHSQPNLLFEQFIHLVIREEAFLKRHLQINPKSDDPPVNAFAARFRSGHDSRSDSRNNYRNDSSNYRNQKGNSFPNNKKNDSKNRWRRSKNSNSNFSIVCQICDTPGHSAKTCRKVLKALAAAVTDDSTEGNWILDSGASAHMTPDLDNLSEAQEYRRLRGL